MWDVFFPLIVAGSVIVVTLVAPVAQAEPEEATESTNPAGADRS